jgi:ATP-dependent RNA helicase SUPV3L1/SUV3
MGLNLNIGRIVFSTIRKFDGVEERTLYPTEIRQIAGRAGIT